MEPMYYIGLDVHKRKISYCVKDSGGKVYAEGSLPATGIDLDLWMKRGHSRGARRWKRRCSAGGSTITASRMPPS
jgi:hypothetical protein